MLQGFKEEPSIRYSGLENALGPEVRLYEFAPQNHSKDGLFEPDSTILVYLCIYISIR